MEVMAQIPSDTFASAVTDPPYHLTSIVKRFGATDAAPAKHGTDGLFARRSRGFMGQKWDGGDIAFRPELWAEVLRVMKPGAHLVAFGGSRTYHRMACAIEDAGFEVRDCILELLSADDMARAFLESLDADQAKAFERLLGSSQPIGSLEWIYGSGFPHSHNQNGRWEGWGTALKPAHEPIVLARKPLGEKSVAANLARWGTGALNIDASRVLGPEYVGEALAGRWPANVIHDGSDEVLAAFPDAPGQLARTSSSSEGRKNQNTYGEMRRGAPGTEMIPRKDRGSAARFFYCAKASKADRGGDNSHPTVKPFELMEYLCRLVTPPGGTVLDPFCGSGSTGKAALANDYKFFGIEMIEAYANISHQRTGGAYLSAEDFSLI